MSALLRASTACLLAGYGIACSLTSCTIHLYIWILSGAPLSFVACMTSSRSVDLQALLFGCSCHEEDPLQGCTVFCKIHCTFMTSQYQCLSLQRSRSKHQTHTCPWRPQATREASPLCAEYDRTKREVKKLEDRMVEMEHQMEATATLAMQTCVCCGVV